MVERRRRKTAADRRAEIVAKMRQGGGEAIKVGGGFRVGGWTVCSESMMLRMARLGYVKIETVGASTFAVVEADHG